jgi:Tol biopolymer transport system component
MDYGKKPRKTPNPRRITMKKMPIPEIERHAVALHHRLDAWASVVILLLVMTVSCTCVSCGSTGSPSIAKSTGGQGIRTIAFSADGSRIAYVEVPKMLLFGAEVFTQLGDKPEGETWLVVKTLTGKPDKIYKLADGSRWADIQWRPGTNEIVMGGRDLLEGGHGRETIYTISADGGTPRVLVDGRDFSISRDGRMLAFVRTMYTSGRGNEGLFVLDLESGGEFKVSDLECKHPRWAGNSDELVYSATLASGLERYKYVKSRGMMYYYGDIYIYDADFGGVRRVTTDGIFENPDFSPDGTRILASSYDARPGTRNRSMVVIDKSTGQWRVLLAPCDSYDSFGDFDFLPDTDRLVFEGRFKNPSMRRVRSRKDLKAYEDDTVTDLFAIGLDGSGLERIDLKGPEYKSEPLFSPDGERFTYCIEYADWNTEFFSIDASKVIED